MKKYIIAIIILLSSLHVYSCNNNIIIAKAKSKNCKDAFDILLLSKSINSISSEIIYLLPCKEEVSEFTYNCLLKKEENVLLIFEEYSSPAGLTKIHYLDIRNGIFYSSDFLQEEKVPLLTTVNIKSASFNILDIDNGNYIKVPLEITWKKEESEQLKHNELEIIQIIDCQY